MQIAILTIWPGVLVSQVYANGRSLASVLLDDAAAFWEISRTRDVAFCVGLACPTVASRTDRKRGTRPSIKDIEAAWISTRDGRLIRIPADLR